MKKKCAVCLLLPLPWGSMVMCRPCARSYDQARNRDASTAALIEWAATRARRYERKRRLAAMFDPVFVHHDARGRRDG